MMAVDLSEERRAKMWLLYLKHMQGHRGRLSLNIIREVCSFFHPFRLVHVTQSFIRFFDFQTGVWKQPLPHSSIKANINSRWVVLEDGGICCSGGERYPGYDVRHNASSTYTEVYIIALDGGVEQKTDMIGARAFTECWLTAKLCMSLEAVRSNQSTVRRKPGYSINYTGRRYIDRTHYSALVTCEKFHLRDNQWNRLPAMRSARYGLNPCVFGRLIYLCGFNSKIMEAFSPETDNFLPVQIPVPQNYPSCLYVDNNLLVLHQTGCIVKFAAGQGGALDKHSEVRAPAASMLQNSQPVVDKVRRLFYVIQGGKCVCFNMDTGVQGPSVA